MLLACQDFDIAVPYPDVCGRHIAPDVNGTLHSFTVGTTHVVGGISAMLYILAADFLPFAAASPL